MPQLLVTLADNTTERITLPGNANPQEQLRAFLTRTGPFGNGDWIELASGKHVRYSLIVSVELAP